MRTHFAPALALLTLLALLAWVAPAHAQGLLEYDPPRRDIGQVAVGQDVTQTFTIRNVGAKTVELNAKRSGCQCLRHTLQPSTLPPGSAATLTLTLSGLEDDLGDFEHSVILHRSDAEQPLVYTLTGTVVEGPYLPDTLGPLAIEARALDLGRVTNQDVVDTLLRIRNLRSTPLTLLAESSEPTITLEPQPTTMLPNSTGELRILFDGSRADAANYPRYKVLQAVVKLTPKDEPDATQVITVAGRYERVYTEEEIAQGPNITFEATEYDAGDILPGEVVEYTFRFTNTGQEPLEIKATKASCGCTATKPSEDVIAPGASAEIVAKFNSWGKTGDQNKTVTVITNDLDTPNIILRLKANVVADPFIQVN